MLPPALGSFCQPKGLFLILLLLHGLCNAGAASELGGLGAQAATEEPAAAALELGVEALEESEAWGLGWEGCLKPS